MRTSPERPRAIADAPASLARATVRRFSKTIVPANLASMRALGRDAAGRTTDVEGAQRELRARLADRLRRDDADGLADLDQAAVREVAAVAERADAARRLAGEDRADLDRLDGGLGDARRDGLGDELVARDDDLVRLRVADVVDRDAAEDALVERLDDVLVVLERLHAHAAERAAVVHRDRHVLRHVDEAAREVARVGRLERRVGEALAGTVRRDEVLDDVQAVLEVGLDRVLDDLVRRAGDRLLRLGHEAAHAAELADLLARATRARVGHHVDGVEARLVLLEGLVEDVRDLVVGRRPDVDDLVVALGLGDEAVVVVRPHLGHLRRRPSASSVVLASGTTMSEIEKLRPPSMACVKPRSLTSSRKRAVFGKLVALKTPEMMPRRFFLVRTALM